MRSASFAERHVTSTTSLSVIEGHLACIARGGRKFTLANRVLRSPCLQAKIQYVFMTSQAIHFGTSGWRGVIAEDFTFAGVRRASAAIADHVLAQNKSPVLLVGYDTRFLSPEFARASAQVLRAHGCGVVLCVEATPTPAIAHAIFDRKLQGGVNITASHNPAQYNGLKFSGPEGGPALPEITKDIERRAAEIKENQPGPGEMADDFEPIGPQAPLARPAKVLEVGRARID